MTKGLSFSIIWKSQYECFATFDIPQKHLYESKGTGVGIDLWAKLDPGFYSILSTIY